MVTVTDLAIGDALEAVAKDVGRGADGGLGVVVVDAADEEGALGLSHVESLSRREEALDFPGGQGVAVRARGAVAARREASRQPALSLWCHRTRSPNKPNDVRCHTSAPSAGCRGALAAGR